MKTSDRNKSRNRNAPDKRVKSGKTETAESELGRGDKRDIRHETKKKTTIGQEVGGIGQWWNRERERREVCVAKRWGSQ